MLITCHDTGSVAPQHAPFRQGRGEQGHAPGLDHNLVLEDWQYVPFPSILILILILSVPPTDIHIWDIVQELVPLAFSTPILNPFELDRNALLSSPSASLPPPPPPPASASHLSSTSTSTSLSLSPSPCPWPWPSTSRQQQQQAEHEHAGRDVFLAYGALANFLRRVYLANYPFAELCMFVEESRGEEAVGRLFVASTNELANVFVCSISRLAVGIRTALRSLYKDHQQQQHHHTVNTVNLTDMTDMTDMTPTLSTPSTPST